MDKIPPAQREVALTAKLRLLNGVERALDRLGWHRGYSAPRKRKATYSGDRTEAVLAKFQKNQGITNHCGAFAVATALRIMAESDPRRAKKVADAEATGVGGVINYDEVIELSNSHAVFRRDVGQGLVDFFTDASYRVWPNGPTMPKQQVALAKKLAAQVGLEITARAMRGTPNDLITYLGEPDSFVVVTIGWGRTNRPSILYTDGVLRDFSPPDHANLGKTKIDFPFNAHTMLLAAYDPGHKVEVDGKSMTLPWGFINSWQDGGKNLYWMTEHDFRDGWRYVIPGVGRQKMVVIQKRV
jgi:hypothetical protein